MSLAPCKYSLLPVTDDAEWDAFIQNSPNGTIFHLSAFLNLCNRSIIRLWVKKGDEARAAVTLPVSDDRKSIELDDLIIHSGICFAPSDPRMKISSNYHERFQITELVIQEISATFFHIRWALAPHFEDLRPFLWHNYHLDSRSDQFQLSLRYTSKLHLGNLSNAESIETGKLFLNFETLRQRQIRKARKEEVVFFETFDHKKFGEDYVVLFKRQGIDVQKKHLDRIIHLCTGLSVAKLGCGFQARTKNGEVAYQLFFGTLSNKAYYLYGAGDNNNAESYSGTYCFWNSMIKLSQKGITDLDLEGINSPKRGAFKLSFGGTIEPYYHVHLR